MRGAVFSGGGAYGAFQVGCCTALIDSEFERGAVTRFDLFNGISVGSINAAFLAQFADFRRGTDALTALWKSFKRRDIWRINPFTPFRSNGLVNTEPLRRLLRAQIDEKAIRRSGNLLRVGVTDVLKGQYIEKTQDDKDLLDWVIASASYPILFPTLQKDGKHYSDGGIFSLTPLRSAIKAGCTEIDVFMADSLEIEEMHSPLKNPWQMAIRTINIMLHSFWMNDLAACAKKNMQVSNGDTMYRHIDVRVWAPLDPLPFSSHAFDPKEIREMIQMGRRCVPVPLDRFLRHS